MCARACEQVVPTPVIPSLRRTWLLKTVAK
jgi:hypothetical protein